MVLTAPRHHRRSCSHYHIAGHTAHDVRSRTARRTVHMEGNGQAQTAAHDAQEEAPHVQAVAGPPAQKGAVAARDAMVAALGGVEAAVTSDAASSVGQVMAFAEAMGVHHSVMLRAAGESEGPLVR